VLEIYCNKIDQHHWQTAQTETYLNVVGTGNILLKGAEFLLSMWTFPVTLDGTNSKKLQLKSAATN